MTDLKKIRDNIIENGFPELMSIDIWIDWKKLKDALIEYGGLTEEGFYIEVDKSLRDAPTEVIEGGLAHDLTHILTDVQQGRNLTLKDRLAYKISKKYKTLDERNTDVTAILRGYGSQLLAFLQYAEEKDFPHYQEDGLSIREISALVNKE
ncbi:hypothetical protein HQ533_04545 [Candidatus Woesearchaeota archaeon]|nr:hypothetical protein [Candidatus Woesearchaeota archaeon]